MAKKSDKTNVVMEPVSKHFCQYCSNHCNKPSKCKTTGKYVARKSPGCDKFKEVK